ncbi:hypothetical protein Hamer_G027869, partial [Homarus americanus]
MSGGEAKVVGGVAEETTDGVFCKTLYTKLGRGGDAHDVVCERVVDVPARVALVVQEHRRQGRITEQSRRVYQEPGK